MYGPDAAGPSPFEGRWRSGRLRVTGMNSGYRTRANCRNGPCAGRRCIPRKHRS